MKCRALCDCDFSERVLYTCFLLLMGLGYLMAVIYLYTGFEGIDKQPGLSVEDIADNYYGNRSGSRLESALRGSMAGYLENKDRDDIVAWINSGSPDEKYEMTVHPIIKQRCLGCHSPASGLNVPDLTSYNTVRQLTSIDTGVSLHSLMKVSHIHLFGIGLVLLGVGMVFRRVVMRTWLKTTLIILPFAAIFVDIAAWFLTKWAPMYAYVIVIAGAVLGISLAVQILSALYQMWFIKEAYSK